MHLNLLFCSSVHYPQRLCRTALGSFIGQLFIHWQLSWYLPCLCSLGQMSPVLSIILQMIVLIDPSCPLPNTLQLLNVPFKMWSSELNKMFWVWCDQGRVQAEALFYFAHHKAINYTTLTLYSHIKLLTPVKTVNNSKTESSKINPYLQGQLIYEKEGKNISKSF